MSAHIMFVRSYGKPCVPDCLASLLLVLKSSANAIILAMDLNITCKRKKRIIKQREGGEVRKERRKKDTEREEEERQGKRGG